MKVKTKILNEFLTRENTSEISNFGKIIAMKIVVSVYFPTTTCWVYHYIILKKHFR